MNKKYKILIVDDDEFLTTLFLRKFRNAGMDAEVINIPDKDFVEQVVKIKPDLISMDILMPKISGFDAVQMIKADPRTKDIPVIFLSNFSQEEEMKKGLALGAIDFLVTAYVVFDDLIKSYLGYLNDPKGYIKRYPVYQEVQKMKFSGKNDDEINKARNSFMDKRFIELGIKTNNQKPTDTAAVGYKRGVFVLVRKLPSGSDSYVTFRYKTNLMPGLEPGFYLAIFNELQFANWYLVNMIKALEGGAKSDMPADGPFFIFEITNQELWDFVRKVVLADGVATDAILNPCEETEAHRCPRTFVRFDQYADFSNLKEVFSHYPNQHVTIAGFGKNEIIMLADPTKLSQDDANDTK